MLAQLGHDHTFEFRGALRRLQKFYEIVTLNTLNGHVYSPGERWEIDRLMKARKRPRPKRFELLTPRFVGSAAFWNSAWGGKRDGAGRPSGSKNQRSADIARQAAEAGITPIEVMLNAMRELWDEGSAEAKREAARIAKDAAPYIHPRLSNIDQTVSERPHYVDPCARALSHGWGVGSER
jgi:hypothetical protein